ncbi:MAG: hypothetical protein OEQ39_17075 [Gammaproteobacteria bacterium]|nr:hypothetical protein [Gammaproteobacteria bacterium]
MVFDYYHRLRKKDRRVYEQSDAHGTVRLPPSPHYRESTDSLSAALQSANRKRVESCCVDLARLVTTALNVPTARIRVLSKRPSHHWGELHGLYESSDDRGPATITLWMRTAQHKRVVAFRTFLRTLLHELCHHLDYTHLQLAESFHTEGFYRRESSLFKQLMAAPGDAPKPRRTIPSDAEQRTAQQALREIRSRLNDP